MNAAISSRPRTLLYSTAPSASTELVNGELVRLPTSTVHAKEVGTALTVCGRSALSWVKFWDLPFIKIPTNRCPDCVAALVDRHSAASGQRI